MAKPGVRIPPHNEEAEVMLESKSDAPLIILAFKLDDTQFGQLTYVRIYQGRLKISGYI